MKSNVLEILDSIKAHAAYRQECLNLIASENVMSPLARFVLASDLANRYSVGRPYERLFPGFKHFDHVEDWAEKTAQRLFHAQYVNVQAPTGMVANMAAYATLLKPNDLVLALPVKHSGHYSHVAENTLSLFQARVEPLPFDEVGYTIDVSKAIQEIRKKTPQLIILGTSEFLFPAPVKALRSICEETGTKILYDGSHVAGLIAGQVFQNPLAEGADMLSLSTNKTLSAPSHGIVACSTTKAYQAKIERAIMPLLTSNHHAHHVAALAITLAEFVAFGKEYATQIVANAKALARALHQEGVSVLCAEKDFTESHTVLIAADNMLAEDVVNRLGQANIMTNAFQLPWDKPGAQTGVRIGTSEMTRLNLKEREMKYVAKLIADVLFKRRTASKVRDDVILLREHFQKVVYCFREDFS